jgi:hypothetical protein
LLQIGEIALGCGAIDPPALHRALALGHTLLVQLFDGVEIIPVGGGDLEGFHEHVGHARDARPRNISACGSCAENLPDARGENLRGLGLFVALRRGISRFAALRIDADRDCGNRCHADE